MKWSEPTESVDNIPQTQLYLMLINTLFYAYSSAHYMRHVSSLHRRHLQVDNYQQTLNTVHIIQLCCNVKKLLYTCMRYHLNYVHKYQRFVATYFFSTRMLTLQLYFYYNYVYSV